MKEQKLQEQIQELICYIWDNYLQLMDQTDSIFLMGIGFAYIGIKSLLLNRGEPSVSVNCPSISRTDEHLVLTASTNHATCIDCKDRISGVVCFVDGILRQVKSDVDTDLSSWYKEHSRIYVANNHACWTDADLARKVLKRRFGTAIRSPAFGLARMLAHHAEEVHGWIRERVAVDEEMAGHGETTEEEQGGA